MKKRANKTSAPVTESGDSTDSRLRATTDISGNEEWTTFLGDIIVRCQGKKEARKQDRSKKREIEILRAALRVFARDGISKSKLGDIAAEAGMPLSTLYEYYSSKEDIAYTVPLATFAQFYQEYAELAEKQKTARDRLKKYLWLTADFARRNPEWARILYLDIWPGMLAAETQMRQSFIDYVRIVHYLIHLGEIRGEWKKDSNPQETATILYSCVNQIIITSLLYRRPQNLSAAADSILDKAMLILQPPAPAAVPATQKSQPRKPKVN